MSLCATSSRGWALAKTTGRSGGPSGPRRRCEEGETAAGWSEESRWHAWSAGREKTRSKSKRAPGAAVQTPARLRRAGPDFDSRTGSKPSSRPYLGCSLHGTRNLPESSGDDAVEYCNDLQYSTTRNDPPRPRRPTGHTKAQLPARIGTRRKPVGGVGSIVSQVFRDHKIIRHIVSARRQKMSPFCNL